MSAIKVEYTQEAFIGERAVRSLGMGDLVPVVRLEALREQLEKLRALNDDAVTSSDRYWVKVAIADILHKLKDPS